MFSPKTEQQQKHPQNNNTFFQIKGGTSTNNKKETQNLEGIDTLIVSQVSLVSHLI